MKPKFAQSFLIYPLALATDVMMCNVIALARNFDVGMSWNEKFFLYLRLQQSEDIEDQASSVALFRAVEEDGTFKSTLRHQEIIQRFGRFSHRAAALGQDSTPEEIAF